MDGGTEIDCRGAPRPTCCEARPAEKVPGTFFSFSAFLAQQGGFGGKGTWYLFSDVAAAGGWRTLLRLGVGFVAVVVASMSIASEDGPVSRLAGPRTVVARML